jgi:hypothetical protein
LGVPIDESSPDVTHGRMWIDPARPRVLHLADEVDHAVVAPARQELSPTDLAGIDVVDMAEATFIDSSVIANLVLHRPDHVDPSPSVTRQTSRAWCSRSLGFCP